MRMFKDLKVLTANTNDFLIRQIVESIVDPKNMEASSHAPSVVSNDTHSGKSESNSERPTAPTACVPFIGEFLLFSIEV